MAKKFLALPALYVPVALLALASCRRDNNNQEFAQSGLRANRMYYCDTVIHSGPVRMFTQGGEVTDAGVISQYLQLRPYLAGSAGAYSEQHPYYIRSTQTTEVHLNGVNIYTATATPASGTFEMRQLDTSKVGRGTANASINIAYQYEQQYRAMRDAVLEMNNSFSKLVRVDSQNYQSFESFYIKGRFADETIVLPYTFVASRVEFNSYPFALKASIAPQVPAGDTLLVQEGKVEFKLRQ